MSKTYQTTGINLKSSPIGEADRLVTILTSDHGLIRAIAPGARKPKSSLGGRVGLFVTNQLLIVRGKSLDRITQAETVNNYRYLSQDLTKLAIGQYWAEIVLDQALTEHPQPELYELLNLHLGRLEETAIRANAQANANDPMAHLCQGIFHLLAQGGIAPQVYNCFASGRAVEPDLANLRWRIGFSIEGGGTVDPLTQENTSGKLYYLSSLEAWLFQQLSSPDLNRLESIGEMDTKAAWIKLEAILRRYIRHHSGQIIRSAELLSIEH
jgi:DNA repair protein RecO (recombination protein O)